MKQFIKNAKLILFFTIIFLVSSCSVPLVLQPKEEVNRQFQDAHKFLNSYFLNDNYFRAKPRNKNDALNYYMENLKNGDKSSDYAIDYYELIRDCTDCTRIIARLTYLKQKRILGILWTEFTEKRYTKDGRKSIRVEEKNIRNDLKKADINNDLLHFVYRSLDKRLNGCKVIENCRPDPSKISISREE